MSHIPLDSSSIFEAFATIPDPREPRNQKHKLFDIIAISILGILCGADDYVTICNWGESNLSWLQEHDICLNGVPSHDTLAKFFRFVDPNEFEKRFVQWTQRVAHAVGGVIAIDGKTIKNSRDNERGGKAVHMISAFAAQNQLILGQLATDSKSNEITAIPRLLDLIDIKGSTVTIDAAGCQKEIAKQIRSKEADYILALKKNQGTLHAEAKNFFDQAIDEDPSETGCDYFVSEERSRSRDEKREIWVVQNLDWLPQKESWEDLTSLICVRSTRKTKDKTSVEHRYYISSLKGDADKLGMEIRLHWGVENKLHWHLDVSYGEDKGKVRKDHGPENVSVLKRCTLNLLKADTSTKMGIKNKRARAGWNRKYLLRLIGVK